MHFIFNYNIESLEIVNEIFFLGNDVIASCQNK